MRRRSSLSVGLTRNGSTKVHGAQATSSQLLDDQEVDQASPGFVLGQAQAKVTPEAEALDPPRERRS